MLTLLTPPDFPKPMPRRASKRQQSQRGHGGKSPPTSSGGLLWSGTHLIPRPAPGSDDHPGPVRGGPPSYRQPAPPPSEQQKKRPGQCKVRKNRLHSRGIWAKIASRRIIRAGRKRRQPLTPLCRRHDLPHSSKTAPHPLYKDSSFFTRMISP